MESVEDLCKNLYNYQNSDIKYSEDSETMFYENEIKLSSPIPIQQEKYEYKEELACSLNTYLAEPFDMKQILLNLSDCNDYTKGIFFDREFHYLNSSDSLN